MTLEEVIEFAGSGREAINIETQEKYFFIRGSIKRPKTGEPIILVNQKNYSTIDLDEVHHYQELYAKLRLL